MPKFKFEHTNNLDASEERIIIAEAQKIKRMIEENNYKIGSEIDGELEIFLKRTRRKKRKKGIYTTQDEILKIALKLIENEIGVLPEQLQKHV